MPRTKIAFFANTKDKTRRLSQSSVVYEFTCPGCSRNDIGKTERTLHERKEHFVQFMKICQFFPIIVTFWTCSVFIDMVLTVTNLKLTRLGVTLLSLTKQIIGTQA